MKDSSYNQNSTLFLYKTNYFLTFGLRQQGLSLLFKTSGSILRKYDLSSNLLPFYVNVP